MTNSYTHLKVCIFLSQIYNNKIVDFRTKDHAISSLIDKVNYTREELELKFYNKVYVVL